ncbi:hypothetical protein [Roseiconus lacunae]|uniref:Tetratricopeptide repeat protein n=1 Tax=Roseiconus lacunae TaxID=2605694 RepID=A0ABT7PLK6_9BACT|nr:hypothetical protein [Roseiconus lacunae]MDM4017358.1 hypothetical protein [Roseiconus lacunae]
MFRFITIAVGTLLFTAAATAQTIQLPSFQTFRYSGSVVVPDQGATSLGSVRRSASRSRSVGSGNITRRGFGQRAGSATGSTGDSSVHVTIIDHDAIDRQLRGLPTRPVTGSAVPKSTRDALKPPRQPGGTSRDRDQSDPDAEGKALVRYARSQYRAGKRSAAFDIYQLAISKLSPRLAELAKAERDRVFPAEQRRLLRGQY